MKNIVFAVLIFALSCMFVVSCSVAGVYQSELKIAPVKVYESILENFKNKRYEEVERAIPYVQPVLSTIKAKFGLDLQPEIQSALKSKSNDFYTTLEKLIFYDIRLIFISIIEQGKSTSPQELKLWFKMAYANYLLLSPAVLKEEKGFISDRKIKKMFREAYSCLGSESPYGGKILPDLKLFEKRSDEIVERILVVFPEIKEKEQE